MKYLLKLPLLVIGCLALPSALWADPKAIPPDQFEALHKMIRVQPEEQRFWRIPWKLSITEARTQAALTKLYSPLKS